MSDKQTKQRLAAILRGAFSGPPTPLKEIPTRLGKRRKLTASEGAASAKAKAAARRAKSQA